MPYSNTPKPKAILFDWDNTLVDTMPLICASINQVLAHFNMPSWSDDEIKKKVQLSAKDSLPGYFGNRWKEALAIYRDFYHQHHLALIKPLEGALDLLKQLQDDHIPIGLVSNKVSSTLRKEVTHLNWDPFFTVLVGSGDAEKDKPHPDPAFLALETMRISASTEIWFVGDAPVDWQCAKAAGCRPIPIGFFHQEAHSYGQAIQNCRDLEKILTKL